MKTYKITIITAAATRVEITGCYQGQDEIHAAIHALWPDARCVHVIGVDA